MTENEVDLEGSGVLPGSHPTHGAVRSGAVMRDIDGPARSRPPSCGEDFPSSWLRRAYYRALILLTLTAQDKFQAETLRRNPPVSLEERTGQNILCKVVPCVTVNESY